MGLLYSALLTAGVFFCFIWLRLGFSFLLFKLIKKKNLAPKISETERSALQAGTSGIEKELFTGRPDFQKLFKQKKPALLPEEIKFLNTKTQELCALSKEWDLVQRRKLHPATESFLKKEKFFGLTIPKKYKGHGFSPLAHAKIIERLASSNIPLSIITMVPNTLGPAELLLKYGTKEQKNKYLPRLALGEDWPCFGLTEVQAGSDASSLKSEGILFKEGDVLKIRLNWSKRWITLSLKASLIGLAVRLKDPDKLYSDKKDLGLTCLLVARHIPGVKNDLLYDPMGLPIYNGSTTGENVIVRAETAIIGGLKRAGKGWTMLMESLSAGRGISLPSLALACSKRTAWLTSSHAFVRKQFGLPIGKFEGVEEALTEMAGLCHLISTTHSLTIASLCQKIHSPVLSALTKYQLTEMAQKINKKGMDIMGGAGLSLGPKNKIALIHKALPLAITVEGSNILTRTLIVYGQGLIKTHPQAYNIISALEQNNLKSFHQNLSLFWRDLMGHGTRGLIFSLTRGWPFFGFFSNKYWRKIIWASSLFAFLNNLNLLFFRDRLKTKGSLCGQMADLLSFQYMALSLLWEEQALKAESPLSLLWKKQSLSLQTKWGLEYCFANIQKSLEAVFQNYPHFWIRFALKPLGFFLRVNPIGCPPSHHLGKQLAQKFLEDEKFRKQLCSNMYFPKDLGDQFQKLNTAYKLSLRESQIMKKIKQKMGKTNLKEDRAAKKALEQKIISPEEYNILQKAKKAQWTAAQVDAWTEKEYFNRP